MESCPGIQDAPPAFPHDIRAVPWPIERPKYRAHPGRARDEIARSCVPTARVRTVATPPIARSSMAPRAWPGSPVRERRETGRADLGKGPHRRVAWRGVAARRRIVLLALIVGQTWLACDFMVRGVLPYHAQQPLEL